MRSPAHTPHPPPPALQTNQIFFAFSLARSTSFLGAAWVLAKCGGALFSFQMVWLHIVDPFVYTKTREYVELGKRRRLPDMTGGSLFSPPPPSSREDPLAERRRGGGGGFGGGGGGGGTPGGGSAMGGMGGGSSRGGGGLSLGRKTSTDKGGSGGGGHLLDDLPTVSSGLRAASVAVGLAALFTTLFLCVKTPRDDNQHGPCNVTNLGPASEQPLQSTHHLLTAGNQPGTRE